MASVHLIGGGWTAAPAVYEGFLAAAGGDPVIGCLVIDEGDGAEQFERFATELTIAGRCRPRPLLVPVGGQLDPADLGAADALLVCGGLTPAYADALAPVAGPVRTWLAATGRPYAGFSAGAAVAAARAIVGGWRSAGVAVCPEDASEDLDEVAIRDGLGLVPFAVDVHAAQWGTLPRAVDAVRRGLVDTALAIDEDTVAIVADGELSVRGRGQVHRVTGAGNGVHVEVIRATG